MRLITYDDLATTIRRNVWKVPSDVDLIVGVPRSGMIAALMLSELTQKPVADVETFMAGQMMECGGRGGLMPKRDIRKVLVLDDTVFYGRSITDVRARLAPLADRYTLIFGCIYTCGENSRKLVDLYFDDVESNPPVAYEWNILHHYETLTEQTMWDIDGLLCKEPPWDCYKEQYEAYLRDPVPMVIPTTRIGAIVTYRLEKYRNVTEEWLGRMGINYGSLIMYPAETSEERNRTCPPYRFKADIYKEFPWAMLFYESNDDQARNIARIACKPVFSYESGRIFNP